MAWGEYQRLRVGKPGEVLDLLLAGGVEQLAADAVGALARSVAAVMETIGPGGRS